MSTDSLLTLIMWPSRCIMGIAERAHSIGPARLVAIVFSICSSVALTIRKGSKIAALLINTSIRGWRSAIVANAARTESGDATSHPTAIARSPISLRCGLDFGSCAPEQDDGFTVSRETSCKGAPQSYAGAGDNNNPWT